MSKVLESEYSASLATRARRSIDLAIEHAWNSAQPEGYWIGEQLSNSSVTAEHVFFHQSLGHKLLADEALYVSYLLSQQQDDGSWPLAPYCPGDVSTTSEVYLALKILGLSPTSTQMKKARQFIRKSGGVAKVRIFTRVYFAQFGLFPWDAVPQLPPEFILLPCLLPVNIYRLASWARATVIPLFIIRHHEPIYALPNGVSKDNDFLDELWLEPDHKMVAYSPSLLSWGKASSVSTFFSLVDRVLFWVGGAIKALPSRQYALELCKTWIVEHQEVQGDWAGIAIPMHFALQALLLEGYTLSDSKIRRGLAALERFTWRNKFGKHLQPCVSPTWDTVLMARGLCDAGVGCKDGRLQRAIEWIKSRQLLDSHGDWSVNNPNLAPGGFCFQYYNSWYPDVDDTAAVILAIVNHDRDAASGMVVTRAALWICGMQNRDGGWGAFDRNNDSLWLNKIPFSDMNAMCDPSSADVTGRVLEAFGQMMRESDKKSITDAGLVHRISAACKAALVYLANTQETTGAWYGRWGVNYIYGTSNVLCGLQFFRDGNGLVQDMIASAAAWLQSHQNQDGGWGETVDSYKDSSLAGQGPSTPSQTAWAIMGLLAAQGPNDKSITAAIEYLLRTQTTCPDIGGTWPEDRHTGTGFPNHFYFGYAFYRHYFPLMALGRYARAVCT
ncbi:Hopene cyclase [Metarhizium guizhouense ARSEF 977]|uniref:Terpene cyclase/mutase family member n=1 Tax=Metarhizium guizhouense (strain ARSEF 977) TaxID=1276136 RepID=A0A0B4H4A1_METGA|nr:Hopene cyclase [Metarhizium guizhouense ARSEF 977]